MTRFLLITLILAITATASLADDAGWNREAAAKVLDARAQAWFDFSEADLGTGATRTTCVSCHTLVPYALARPALRKALGESNPPAQQTRLLSNSRLRAKHWNDLDDAKFGLIYDSPEQKRKESLGTEAVFHAAILSFQDRAEGRAKASDETRAAFKNLWGRQHTEGPLKGAWDWLNFGLEPWESKHAPYFGAALAAVALGTAPGDSIATDESAKEPIAHLKSFLSGRLPDQSLYNQAWALWASAALKGTLSEAEQKGIIERLFARQEVDGGWRLATLGDYVRSDGTEQRKGSDAYATGLVLHALHVAGVPKSDPRVAKGLVWLKQNQTPAGGWIAESVNQKRDPETHVGKFMSDAATAFAVLALTD